MRGRFGGELPVGQGHGRPGFGARKLPSGAHPVTVPKRNRAGARGTPPAAQRGLGPIGRFIAKFAALMALYYILVAFPLGDRWLYYYLQANAQLANALLRWWGAGTTVTDISIRSVHFAITVRRGCDAVEPSWMFCAAVLSFPASARSRLIGCAAGTLLLQVLNLIRITSLYYIGWLHPGLFARAHLEVWPVVFILAAVVLWMVWIRRLARPGPSEKHATP